MMARLINHRRGWLRFDKPASTYPIKHNDTLCSGKVARSPGPRASNAGTFEQIRRRRNVSLKKKNFSYPVLFLFASIFILYIPALDFPTASRCARQITFDFAGGERERERRIRRRNWNNTGIEHEFSFTASRVHRKMSAARMFASRGERQGSSFLREIASLTVERRGRNWPRVGQRPQASASFSFLQRSRWTIDY